MRAGLNERSQSAYAIPAPNPVESAIGQPRPCMTKRAGQYSKSGLDENRRTTEEDDRSDDAGAKANAAAKGVSIEHNLVGWLH